MYQRRFSEALEDQPVTSLGPFIEGMHDFF
jgi:hypothetical protein